MTTPSHNYREKKDMRQVADFAINYSNDTVLTLQFMPALRSEWRTPPEGSSRQVEIKVKKVLSLDEQTFATREIVAEIRLSEKIRKRADLTEDEGERLVTFFLSKAAQLIEEEMPGWFVSEIVFSDGHPDLCEYPDDIAGFREQHGVPHHHGFLLNYKRKDLFAEVFLQPI